MATLTPSEHMMRSVEQEFVKEFGDKLRVIAEDMILETMRNLAENMDFKSLLKPHDLTQDVILRYVKTDKCPNPHCIYHTSPLSQEIDLKKGKDAK